MKVLYGSVDLGSHLIGCFYSTVLNLILSQSNFLWESLGHYKQKQVEEACEAIEDLFHFNLSWKTFWGFVWFTNPQI